MPKTVFFSSIALAVTTIDRLWRNIILLARLFWLPWLASTAVTIVWLAFWQANLTLVLPTSPYIVHDLIINLIWAPFFALITVAVLRSSLKHNDNKRRLPLKFDRTTWLVSALYAGLFLSYPLIDMMMDAIRSAIYLWNWPPDLGPHDFSVVPLWIRLLIVAGSWPAYVLINLAFMAMISTAVYNNGLDLGKTGRLLRAAPLGILKFTLLISAAYVGFDMLYDNVFQVLGFNDRQFVRHFNWQDTVLPSAKYYAADLPRIFLLSMLQLLAMREIYHVLTKTRNELTRRVDLARQKKRR